MVVETGESKDARPEPSAMRPGADDANEDRAPQTFEAARARAANRTFDGDPCMAIREYLRPKFSARLT